MSASKRKNRIALLRSKRFQQRDREAQQRRRTAQADEDVVYIQIPEEEEEEEEEPRERYFAFGGDQESSSQLASTSSSSLSSSSEEDGREGPIIYIHEPDQENEDQQMLNMFKMSGPVPIDDYHHDDPDDDDGEDEEDEEEESSNSELDALALAYGAESASSSSSSSSEDFSQNVSTPSAVPRRIRQHNAYARKRRLSVESPSKRRRTASLDPSSAVIQAQDAEISSLKEKVKELRALLLAQDDPDYSKHPKAAKTEDGAVAEWKIRKASTWAAGPDVKLHSAPFYVPGNILTKLMLKYKAIDDSAWLYLSFGDLSVETRLSFSISVLGERAFERVSAADLVVQPRPLDWSTGYGARVMAIEDLKNFKHLTLRVEIYEMVPRLTTSTIDDLELELE